MGNQRRRRAMEENAAAQKRIADSTEKQADFQNQVGREDLAMRREMMDRILPYAQELLDNPDATLGYDETPFPTFNRPDFTGNIRRDYYGDLADITKASNRSVADADAYMTASGLGRSGRRGAAIGSIYAGRGAEQGLARRNYQSRLEGEDRARYADERELGLLKLADSRARGSERANLRLAGLNVMAGQQGTLNPAQWFSGATSSYGTAAGAHGASAQSQEAAGRLPGAWSRIGGALGAGAALASGTPGGIRGLWR